jgi:hypothetical protein
MVRPGSAILPPDPDGPKVPHRVAVRIKGWGVFAIRSKRLIYREVQVT